MSEEGKVSRGHAPAQIAQNSQQPGQVIPVINPSFGGTPGQVFAVSNVPPIPWSNVQPGQAPSTSPAAPPPAKK